MAVSTSILTETLFSISTVISFVVNENLNRFQFANLSMIEYLQSSISHFEDIRDTEYSAPQVSARAALNCLTNFFCNQACAWAKLRTSHVELLQFFGKIKTDRREPISASARRKLRESDLGL